MTPIQLMVLAGILLLITALNMKLAIWYIGRKQAKQALHHYSTTRQSEDNVLKPIAFSLSEIKCADAIEKNIGSYLDALSSNEIEKIGIIKEDTLVAVMIPIERYEKFIEYVSQGQRASVQRIKKAF